MGRSTGVVLDPNHILFSRMTTMKINGSNATFVTTSNMPYGHSTSVVTTSGTFIRNSER